MQTKFQRVVSTAIKLIFHSNAVLYPAACLAEQAKSEKNASKQGKQGIFHSPGRPAISLFSLIFSN